MTTTETPPDAVPADGATPGEELEFERLAAAVDRAMAAVDDLDDDARAVSTALKDAVEAFHAPALVHIVRTLRDDPRGKELLFELVDDPGVRAIFGLHGIIKADPMTRARQALGSVRPYLHSHGGDVELVRIEDGVAFVRLHGSCNGCSMSAVTLRDGVEEALVAIPEIDRIEELKDEPTTAFIAVEMIGRKPNADAGWVKGPPVDAVSEHSMLRFDIEGANEAGPITESFVVTNIDQKFAVFRNACVHQGLTLDGGMIDDGMLICPWHGFKFEATTGECISAPGAQLEQLPTRIDDGHVWVRTPGG